MSELDLVLAGLEERQRRFAFADVPEGQAAADVAAASGYSGTRASLRTAGYRNRRHPKIRAATEMLRRAASGGALAPTQPAGEEADAASTRGFVWVSNGRGPPRDDGVDPSTVDPAMSPLEGPFRPQPGPQTDFATCDADIVVYGGGAGGGKSYAALLELVKWSHVAGYRGIVFRRTNKQIKAGGSLWDKAQSIFPEFGGVFREGNALDCRFPSGARIEFSHMQRENDRFSHQGPQYDLVVFDEATQFSRSQFWFLYGRLRSTCGMRPYLRATCNPDSNSFVWELVKWYIDQETGLPIEERVGVVRWFVRVDDELHWYDTEEDAREAFPDEDPDSFTFIPARLTDNRALVEADPRYRGRLQKQSRAERERLLGGNWLVQEGGGMTFNRDNFKLADGPPARVIQTLRCWDKAASKPSERYPNPDWTRGVRIHLCEGGLWWIDDLESLRDGPTAVLGKMLEVAELDGPTVQVGIWQDSAQAGLVDVEATRAYLARFPVIAVPSHTSDKSHIGTAEHASSRAKRAFARVWAHRVEAEKVYVKRGMPWTKTLIDECHDFPDASKDDIVDAISLAAQIFPQVDGIEGFSQPKEPPKGPTGLPTRGRGGRRTW